MENALQVNEPQRIEHAHREAATSATPPKRIVEVRPSLDVLENGDAIRIVADVPGVDAAHADVHAEMPHLRIACTRTASASVAIRYAATLTLPEAIDPDSLTAELHDGVLEVAMQKSPKARARRIHVTHG